MDEEAFMTMYSLMAGYAKIELNADGYASYFKDKAVINTIWIGMS